MSSRPIELFYSYSHKDEELRQQLETHLKLLKRQGIISGWNDRDIEGGEEWAGQISEHLEAAGIILLLVSADFIASDYCYDIELKRALERHQSKEARVIPIILRPCDWDTTSFAKLQALPKNGQAVTSWQNRDEAFLDIAKGIRKVVENLTRKSSSVSSQVSKADHDNIKVTDLPSVWNIPHLRNPNFTGREELLADLRAGLTSGKSMALTQAIHGMGGVGKTQLAVEYAFRFASEYDIVWWVQSEEPAKLVDDYGRLAEKLGLPQKDSKAVEQVKEWLRHNRGWLLIFDNAPDAASVRDYIPGAATGHVIVTSRSRSWQGIANPLSVKVLSIEEAVEFLLNRTKQSDEAAAKSLAEALGCLPLALAQAGAYIEATGSTLHHYLDLFQQDQRELLRRPDPSGITKETVASTWSISFQRVEEESPAAADLTKLFAFLAPESFPKHLLTEQKEFLPEPLAGAMAAPLALDDALLSLQRYSLVEVSDDAISVHRLVQSVTRFQMDENTKNVWIEAAVHIVNSAFPNESNDVRTWGICSPLLPHALTTASYAEASNLAAEETSRLLNRSASYLRERAEFVQAQALLKRALAISEAAFGPDHPTIAVHLNDLGIVLKSLGDLAGAKSNVERALAIDEAAFGPTHLRVAIRLNNLGLVLQELGDLAGAKSSLEQALTISEAAFGPDHPSVATRLNNLGLLMIELEDYAGAKANLERALAIGEAVFGPDHPQVATFVNSLGLLMMELDDFAGAKTNFERSLQILRRYFKEDHPYIIRGSNNLRIIEAEIDKANSKTD